ncbi:MAG: hypothetical protein K2X81_11100 [Candidatus Obscuribacterales bacterium]|nr:hypothetical protein [Candidatus Obscuribacterales bacterium]
MVEGREIEENKVSTGEVEARSTFKPDISMPATKDFTDSKSSKPAGLPSEFGSASGFQIVDSSQSGAKANGRLEGGKSSNSAEQSIPNSPASSEKQNALPAASDKSAPAQKAQSSENQPLTDKTATAENKKAADDKTVRPLDKPDYSKLSPEQKAKEAKDIANEIQEKGLSDRATRDHLRSVMLQAYLGGDLNSKGDLKAMNDVIKQVNENLPKGQQLKIAQPANDQDYAKFMDQSNALIAKNPGMQLGAHGQIQFVKTGEDGKEQLLAKTHFAASLRKPK